MRVLALDIGLRRTGVAYFDSTIDVPLPLSTIKHQSPQELRDAVHILLHDRHITHIVIGLPLLLSGKEGYQSSLVREYTNILCLPDYTTCVFQDERCSTPKFHTSNPDAIAALSLLEVFLKKNH